MRAQIAVYVVLTALALIAPFLGLYPVFLMKLLCFAMFACAFNLLLGYTKMLSFGHAAYFGASAYVTGWLTTVHGWGTLEGILGGVAVAMLLGLVIGAIAGTLVDWDPSHSVLSIPLTIFEYSESPDANLNAQAWATAFVLIAFVLVASLTAPLASAALICGS